MSNIVNKTTSEVTNEFWDEMEQSDFSFPHVTIGQSTTDSSRGKPGHFNFNIGKSEPEILGCKLILPKKNRVLYGPKGQRSRCKSDNYHSPSAHVINPISHDCNTCPAARWEQNDTKDRIALETRPLNYDPKKPLCNETYKLLMADSNWLPFWIQFQKTQLKVVSDQLLTRLRYDFFGQEPYTIAFDMKIRKIGTYYSAFFENFKVAEDGERGRTLYLQIKSRAEEILAKDHETMDRAYDAGAGGQRDVTPSNDPWPDSPPPGFNDNDEIPF